MKFYFVDAKGDQSVNTWASPLKEVSAAKAEFMGQGFKRKQISVAEADVPTSKTDLLEWLKTNVKAYEPSV